MKPFIFLIAILVSTAHAEPSESPLPKGLSANQINELFHKNSLKIKECYHSGLRRKRDLEGSLSLSFQILPSGWVKDLKVRDDTLHSERVKDCITSMVKNWRFPTAPVDTYVAAYPLKFRP